MTAPDLSLTASCGVLPEAALPAEVLALLDSGPPLVWCEPTPRRTRLEGFPGLSDGDHAALRPFLTGSFPLDEARLFWPDAWLHFVPARSTGLRWAAFATGPTEPSWLAGLRSRSSSTENQVWTNLHAQDHPVLLMQDWKRYGITGPHSTLREVQMREYFHGTTLVTWNLTRK